MNKSMLKIIYYENVLEFKMNTKEQLNLNEINNWKLCRTCLADTCDDDANMEKMSAIDVMQGTFLNIKEMLAEATNIKISTNENLPLQICKECINKITALYYFSIQVRKADKVLKRLANKLKASSDILEEAGETENNLAKTAEISDDYSMMIVEAEESYGCSQDFVNLEDNGNISADENKTLKDEFEKSIDNNIESILKNQGTELLQEEKESLLETGETDLLEREEYHIDLRSDSGDEKSHFVNDLFEGSENGYVNEETTNITTITTENVKNEVKRPRKRVSNIKAPPGYKHKQPRVTRPLLNDFDCAICQDSFVRQQDLVHHVRESHPNSKAYKCRVCDNLFSHIQSLSRHMNTHKATVILHQCDFCAKSFVRIDDLKRHVRIHTGERPYVCSFCKKSYQQHSDLKYHEEKHTHNLTPRKFQCDQCKQNYRSRTGLYLHKRKHHRQAADDNEVSCDYSLCEISFHLRTESVKCSECDEPFTSLNALCTHKKEHHKTVRQSENECGKENEDFTTIDEEGDNQN